MMAGRILAVRSAGRCDVTGSDKEKVVGILKATASHAFLGTCDGDTPVIRSVSPIVEDDLSIWVTTFANANKVKQIRRNPKVCLLFVELPRGEKRAAVYGKAEVVSDLATRKRVWSLATFNLSEYFPGGVESSDFGVLRIVPEEIHWQESWSGEGKVYRPKG
jgi:general stress protein 26